MPSLEPFEPLAARGDGVPEARRALVLPVRGDGYGVELEVVRVVLEAPVLTRLLGAPPGYLGATNVRGEVVPVLDLGAVLGVGPLGGAPYAAVVDTEHGPVGLAAGAVPRALAIDEDLGASDLPLGVGRRRSGDRVVTMVDPDALLRAAA